MLDVARGRIERLMELAERAASRGRLDLSDRYVALARAIGARYNVRLGGALRALYCRRCSAFWLEGRTVRSRLRRGRLVRTCLRCGEVARRVLTGRPRLDPTSASPKGAEGPARRTDR